MCIARLITCVVVPAFSAALLAQAPATTQATDPYKPFADDAGTWDANVNMYFGGPNKSPTESKGIETTELVGGGKASRTTFKYKMRNRPFEGHGLYGYDARTKEYTGLWVDNFAAAPSLMKGTYDPAQKTLTLLSTSVDGAGTEMKVKHVAKHIDERTKTLEIFMIVDAPGGKTQDLLLMSMTAKKRP